MGAGQLTVAFAPTLQIALIGRIMVGIGDACTFISMIRLVNIWYTGAKASSLQQWLSTVGQLGQILSAIPFMALLHLNGWVFAFASVASVSVLVVLLLTFAVAAEPVHPQSEVPSLASVFATLKRNVKKPVTWQAFFTHFTTQSSGTTMALLWGVPFMVSALGHDRSFAALGLTFLVLINASMGPVVGALCAKRPELRGAWVYGVVGAIVAAWIAVICYPGVTPNWLLFLTLGLIGLGGPTSMIAFDYSKQEIPARELGSTNGVINVGGFLAAFTMMWLIGISLDAQGPSKLYSLDHFRIALAAQFVVIAIGTLGIAAASRARNKSA